MGTGEHQGSVCLESLRLLVENSLKFDCFIQVKVSNNLVAVGVIGCWSPIMSWATAYERHNAYILLYSRTLANRIAPDVTTQNAASDLGLFCLLL